MDGFTLVRCRCGLRMLDGIDDSQAMTANTETYGDEEYNRWYRSMREILMTRYRNDIDEITAIVGHTGRILDVGCAYGWFLEAARERGWEAQGVEVEDATASEARANGLEVFTGTLDEAAFASESFDAIGLWDVLEHIPDLDAFLAECARVMKPGAVLAVNSPNGGSVMARMAKQDWSWLLLPQHIYHFTPRSMRQTLERRGFEVVRLYTWEPVEAFMIDLGKRAPALTRGRFGRRVTSPVLRAASRAWSSMGRGGLIRAYARKRA